MTLYAVYDAASGTIVGHSDGHAEPDLPEGYAALEVAGGQTLAGMAVADGALIAAEPPPPDLDALRARRRGEAEAVVAGKLAGGCLTAIGVVDCDEVNQSRIASIVLDALTAKLAGDATWSIRWRLFDKSFSDPLSADEMIGFAKQAKAYVGACLDAFWAAEGALDAASTADAIFAVDITANYPSQGA